VSAVPAELVATPPELSLIESYQGQCGAVAAPADHRDGRNRGTGRGHRAGFDDT
jgi:hypothetical protein